MKDCLLLVDLIVCYWMLLNVVVLIVCGLWVVWIVWMMWFVVIDILLLIFVYCMCDVC